MGDKTAIEWTDATWNPIRGCSRVSEGCRFCYAERVAARFSGRGDAYEGLAEMTVAGPRWTGEVRLIEEHLADPLRWTRPRRIFVNSMSDLFHEKVPDEWIDRIFAVMGLAEQHVFQVLTKRPERMVAYFNVGDNTRSRNRGGVAGRERKVSDAALEILHERRERDIRAISWDHPGWPFPNVQLGTSCEDQKTADERIPWLLKTPAAVRFLSLEPLLGPIDLRKLHSPFFEPGFSVSREVYPLDGLMAIPDSDWSVPRVDWIIVGGESGGPNDRALVEGCHHVTSDDCHHPLRDKKGWIARWHPRPSSLVYVRSLRDQCLGAGVPFFFKQWGGPTPKSGGRVLDGREWSEYPR